ncbi:hypothetical protein PILCRDRAFT_830262 [Piloderma croceum F 1598]|uniref:Uncharacterized protein n=1 Tax=Piloderma croceum (strain F 1598) TaxID=765440 RepID=A0A0C3EUU1_PILCF|nr:hypothetical protein PILCRDRAFT_830262 [Piloderma croceum F 1598]
MRTPVPVQTPRTKITPETVTKDTKVDVPVTVINVSFRQGGMVSHVRSGRRLNLLKVTGHAVHDDQTVST